MEKEEIIEYLKIHKKELERNFGIQKMALFGSINTSEFKEKSDVDLLIHVRKKDKTWSNYLALEELLQKSLGRKIDLVYFESLNPLVKKTIDQLIYV